MVVVDKDSGKGLSAWMYWGPKYTGFKGCDASNLGELILAETPGPHHIAQRPANRSRGFSENSTPSVSAD